MLFRRDAVDHIGFSTQGTPLARFKYTASAAGIIAGACDKTKRFSVTLGFETTCNAAICQDRLGTNVVYK